MAAIERKTIIVTGGEGPIGGLLVGQLRDANADVISVNVSVWEPTLMTALGMATLLDRLGSRPIDILVNLGSLTCCKEARKEIAAQAKAYRAGLITAAMVSRALLPGMKALNAGHIASVGACFDDRPIGEFGIWSSQAAGHRGLTKALSSEAGNSCVRVSYVDVQADEHDDDDVADRIFAAITHVDRHRIGAVTLASMPAVWQRSLPAISAGIEPLPSSAFPHADGQYQPRYH